MALWRNTEAEIGGCNTSSVWYWVVQMRDDNRTRRALVDLENEGWISEKRVVFYLFISVCVCAQSCLTLWVPMDCSPPGSSVHGIFQARILEWVAFSFSRGLFWPRDWTQVSHIAGRPFTIWATREAHCLCLCVYFHFIGIFLCHYKLPFIYDFIIPFESCI